MISGIDPSSQLFLSDLDRIQQRMEHAQRELSSGRRVNSAADAPDQISEILQLHADLARNTQIQANLGRVQTEVDSAEAAIENAVQLVERATVLASQGATGTQTVEGRQAMAIEVEALQGQLVTASRTSVEGRYVFSGDSDQSPAYALDLTASNGVNRLLTNLSTREVEHPGGNTFPIAKTAEEIFDPRDASDAPAADNAFAALNNLRIALQNDDEAGISAALTSLRQAHDHLSVELSFYGATQNRISEATDFAAKLDVRMKSELSQMEDADVASSILELTQARTQQDAALSAQAKMPRTTLFDYLG